MDYEEFDSESFNAETFGTNKNRFTALIIQLQKSGYIEGLNIRCHKVVGTQILPPIKPVITIKGLEYLNENSLMKKAAELAKGIVETYINKI